MKRPTPPADSHSRRRFPGLQTCITNGNSKLGNCYTVSLSPSMLCQHQPCFRSCYARRIEVRQPTTRDAWTANTQLAIGNPDWYFGDVAHVLAARNPDRFRWHVGGEIPTTHYLGRMVELARAHRATRFLCFSKAYHLVAAHISHVGPLPPNLRLVLSTWPGLPLYNPHRLPTAWIRQDPDTPPTATACAGSCQSCHFCWRIRPGAHVAFPIH